MNRLRAGKPVRLTPRRGTKHLRGGTQRPPVSGRALVRRAWRFNGAGRFDEALALMRQVPPADRRGEEYLLLMTLLFMNLQKNRAMLAYARKLRDADPQDDFNWVLLAMAAHRVGGQSAVARVWREAVQHNPAAAAAHCRLADALCQLGKLRKAREHLKIALFLERRLIRPVMDDPSFAAIWETIAEAGPPPPLKGEEWKECDGPAGGPP